MVVMGASELEKDKETGEQVPVMRFKATLDA